MAAAVASAIGFSRASTTSDPPAPHDKPSADDVLEGFDKVHPSEGGARPMYTLYTRKDSPRVLAELPPDFESQPFLFGNCLPSGFSVAGIQGDTALYRWKRYDDRLGLVAPRLDVRTTGDLESEKSIDVLYTDRVMLDVPILAEGAGGGPIIDLHELFVDRSTIFFQFIPGHLDPSMAVVKTAKSFDKNVTLSWQMPYRSPGQIDDGQLITIGYSMSLLPKEPDYTPREADPRVGYFINSFYDIAAAPNGSPRYRMIKRWKLEKADPSLKLSPPREPIVFYIDHKTPIRWRRWVREGVLEWNKAFEEVGIANAIEVYQQDARTGAHMEKDPESVRYNFIVWNSNDIAFAIGPCRTDPRTGQILDADVVMNDGWLRAAVNAYRDFVAEGFAAELGPETTAWLDAHPNWDPRLKLARRLGPSSSELPRAGTMSVNMGINAKIDATRADATACAQCSQRAADIAIASYFAINDDPADPLADVPEDFIGQQIKDVIMHEVGHVLGLRHNFKASTVYSLEQLASDEWQDKPISGSVMDYNAVHYDYDGQHVRGPYFMTTLGPYDRWAIRYGYATEDQLEDILAESTKPEHVFLTDEDLYGPDPAARTRDIGADALDFADAQMTLIQGLREQIPERALKEGKTFQRARDAYMTLFYLQVGTLSTIHRYIGGVNLSRELYSPEAPNPTTPVDPAVQRRALSQFIDYLLRDDAFGLTPELLSKMSMDKWFDQATIPFDVPDAQLDVHDLVLDLQISGLTALLNPTKLRRIYDNEFRIPSDQDAFTLAELLDDLQGAIWTELETDAAGPFTLRQPFISSLRRNLQREHLERMIALSLPGAMTGAAAKPIATLSTAHLRELSARISTVLDAHADDLDPYSRAHLADAQTRINQALEAIYVYQAP
jgi:hypothetical protein